MILINYINKIVKYNYDQYFHVVGGGGGGVGSGSVKVEINN